MKWEQPPRLFTGIISIIIIMSFGFENMPSIRLAWVLVWLVVYIIGFIYWNVRL